MRDRVPSKTANISTLFHYRIRDIFLDFPPACIEEMTQNCPGNKKISELHWSRDWTLETALVFSRYTTKKT